MSRQTQADLLIKTLAEFRDAQCERDVARLRLECRAHAQRFIQAFRPELLDAGHPSDWISQSEQAAHAALGAVQNE